MRIRVLLGTIDCSLLYSDVVIAIDVLRSSTTILAALANGAESVIPVASVDEALTVGNRLQALVGGEVNSVKPPMFHLGNSPLEYARYKVGGKKVVLYTSSGTRLLRFLMTVSNKVLVGAVVNVSALVEYIVEKGFENIVIVTAGKIGSPALEDSYCAGLIAKSLPWKACDVNAEIVMKMAELNIGVVKRSLHALELVKLGLESDVEYSLTPDSIRIVAGADHFKGCIRLL
ncbi:MAG: 2-phosphosulfolactate phosphatase [Thermoproteota archaeon]|nr:2-phosphosulfolactate phosphatase [Candidatus Brockarchaeota archaeon]